MTFWIAYFALGSFAGILAGLLGVGGGLVIVPALSFIFAMQQHIPAEYIQHLALGTSLASIIFTSISSMRAHNSRGAVIWLIVRNITPGILAGTLFGAWIAAQLSTLFLTWVFIIFICYVSTQMILDIKPKPHRQLPDILATSGLGSVIGTISSLVGIGGGTMSVPFMLWCNVPLHSAIGTSAAIGFPIALAGAAGYVLNGLNNPALPPYSIGFVYLPALLGISLASILTAPLGARLAHNLPVSRLKKIFAVMLIIIAAKMLLKTV